MQSDTFQQKMDELVGELEKGNESGCAERADRLVNALLAEEPRDDGQLLWSFLYRHKAYFEMDERQTDKIALGFVRVAFHEKWFEHSQNWQWILSTSTEIAFRNADVETLEILTPPLLEGAQRLGKESQVLTNLAMFYRGLSFEDKALQFETVLNDIDVDEEESDEEDEEEVDEEILAAVRAVREVLDLLMSMGKDIEAVLHEGDTESTQECLEVLVGSINDSLKKNAISKDMIEYQFLQKKITLAYIDCLLRKREKGIESLESLFHAATNESEVESSKSFLKVHLLQRLLPKKNSELEILVIEGIRQFGSPGIGLIHDSLRFSTYRALVLGHKDRELMLSHLSKVLLGLPEEPRGIEVLAANWILGIYAFHLRNDPRPISSEVLHEYSQTFESTCRRIGVSIESLAATKPPAWPDWGLDWKNLTGALSEI